MQRSLSKVTPFLTGIDIVYGDLIIVESPKEWIKKYNEPVSFGYFLGDTFPHQGSFIRKVIFEKTGYFDETFKLSSDWKFFIEAICRHNASHRYVDFTVSRYDYSGVSSNPENKKKMESEKQLILAKEFPHFFEEYKELLSLPANTLYWQIRGRLKCILDLEDYLSIIKISGYFHYHTLF